MSNRIVLFSLPSLLLLDVLAQWIDLKDFSRLDTANCNETFRPFIREYIPRMKKVVWTMTRVTTGMLMYAILRKFNTINACGTTIMNVNECRLDGFANETFTRDANELMGYYLSNVELFSLNENHQALIDKMFTLWKHHRELMTDFDWAYSLNHRQQSELKVKVLKSSCTLRYRNRNDQAKLNHEVALQEQEILRLGCVWNLRIGDDYGLAARKEIKFIDSLNTMREQEMRNQVETFVNTVDLVSGRNLKC